MSSLLTQTKDSTQSIHKNLIISAGIISGATLFSRILGFVRDMIIANVFGAEMVSDAFFIAFRLPNLLRRLMGEGALSSSFIPVFTEYLHQRTEKETWNLVSNVLTFMMLILLGIVILSMVFAPWIVTIFAPGYHHYPEKFHLTTLLARILFPYIFFIGLVALSMGILNSLNHFLIPAITPALLNIGMIAGMYCISPHLQRPIIGLAIGVLLGGLAQLFLQFPILVQKGMPFKLGLNLQHEGLRRICLLILPSTLGLAVAEINTMVDTVLATFLPVGSVSYLYYSNRLIQFPLGLFGIAIGTAILPTLSAQAARGEIDDLKETFSFGLRLVLFITLPATVGLITFREPIVRILFQRGAFTQVAAQATAFALLHYAFGLFAYAAVKVVVPVYYSFQDTKTPVLIAVVSMISNIVFNLLLMRPMSYGGLALASSLSSTLNLVLLMWYLRKKMGRIGGKIILSSCWKMVLASSIMGFGALFMVEKVNYHRTSSSMSIGGLGLAILFSVLVYLFISFILKSPEMTFFIEAFKKRV